MDDKPTGAGKSSFELVDVDRVFTALHLKDNTAFLDLACGSGAYTLEARRRIGPGGRIWAFDLWQEGIETLAGKIDEQNLENTFASCIDISRQVPLDDRSIDVCLMSTVLHDLIQDRIDHSTLLEVCRVLKTEGTLAVVEFKKFDGPPGPPIHIKMSPAETEAYLSRYGFQTVHTMSVGPDNYLSLFTPAITSSQ